jgi:hypothetical protein
VADNWRLLVEFDAEGGLAAPAGAIVEIRDL